MSTFKLLGERRFLPFFVVQFLGALNDNLFKNAMLTLIAFSGASEAEAGIHGTAAAGLFILPFFVFSPVAGQLADRFEKSHLMRLVKIAEIVIMLIGAIGFYTDSLAVLYGVLFLMGTHSAFFGPVKYSILPQHLQETELVAGNALVEMGTFLAILIGTIAGGLLAGSHNVHIISAGIFTVAFLGYLASRGIPLAPATAPGLKLSWNPFSQTVVLTRIIRKKEALLNSIMGISWYWYFGATMLSQLPNFTRATLHANETVMTLLLGTFAISIGVGSLMCERFSRGEIELGIVPFGAVGMSVFMGALFFIDYPGGEGPLQNISEFLNGANAISNRYVVADLALMGIFSSFFIVPLYALIQHRADPDSRSRVIAANNVYNSIFMVVSSIIIMGLYKINFNVVEILLFTAILNAVVCIYIFLLIPEFFMRFVLWILASTIYKLRYEGRDHVPRMGAAVIVCNHISFIDWFIVTAACRRPVRFVMDHHFFKMPVVGWLFRAAKAIPIAPAKEDNALKEKAFERIAFELSDGNLVCIFPEGRITHDGALGPFKPGVDRILAANPVPVVPMALTGLWGSFFSRKGGKAMHHMPKPTRRRIGVTIDAPMPATTKAGEMEAKVAAMLGPEARLPAGDHKAAAAT